MFLKVPLKPSYKGVSLFGILQDKDFCLKVLDSRLVKVKRELKIHKLFRSNLVVEKFKYMNNLDEYYGFLCLSISKDLVFHPSGLKTPKEAR